MEVLEVKVEKEVMVVIQIKAIMKKMNGRVNLKRKMMCGVMMYYFIIKSYDYQDYIKKHSGTKYSDDENSKKKKTKKQDNIWGDVTEKNEKSTKK